MQYLAGLGDILRSVLCHQDSTSSLPIVDRGQWVEQTRTIRSDKGFVGFASESTGHFYLEKIGAGLVLPPSLLLEPRRLGSRIFPTGSEQKAYCYLLLPEK